MREYSEKKTELEARLSAYDSNIEAYTNGTMNNDKFAIEENIQLIEKELKGEV